ncbi:HMG domain-containing protein 4-like isoform X3 [Ostrea edulis]|uniref:HMG domain-containing protein 4-like isoform X3 n=1 Tax=Ostrea edulis TaxID=37623 RepID=UPI0024AF75A1|nr:HMG domain-containing protein 4-like isoform X3 [Ostrea edulis]
MASKRKRESDIDYSELSAKISKTGDDIPSHSRSGRARKKPARFLDEEDGEESPSEDQEVESKTEEIQEVKHTPTLIAATPQIISSAPQLIMATPQIISAAPQLINATQLISVAPHLINSSPQLISSSPQLISTAPQLIGSGPQLISAPSQLIASASQVIAGAPQMIVTQEPLIQPKLEASETPKSSRVRKKSAKVIEMEEFEKAEKVKSTKRGTKIASPESATVTVSPTPGTGIQPQILQAANIQLNLMNALHNTSASGDSQSTLLAHLRKNPQIVRVADDPKLAAVKTEPMLVSGPFVSPGETVMGDQNSSVKDEPIDTVDPNVLLPQSTPGSALLTHLTKMAQQEGNITPSKTSARKKPPKPKIKEEPGPSMAGDSHNKSVIKMLLNKPAQFSEPVISTQTLSQIKSPTSDKNVKKPIKLKLTTEPPAVSHVGSAGDAFSHVASVTVTSPVDSNKPSTSGAGSTKKKAKKTKRKQSVSVLDDEDEDDEEYDEDDDDDDDLIDDDMDDNEDDMDWEFETQDGNLIIADEVPKKSVKKTPSKKKGKKDDSQSLAGASKDKKSIGQKEKKKKRLTAYTMWCNSVRYKVLNENPGIDFAQLSRRLGEIWQSVPAKDKMAWKRKAKREARKLFGKGLLITTGKGGGGTPAQAIATAAPVPPSSSNTPPPIYHPPIRHHSTKHHSANTSSTAVSVKQQEEMISPSKMLGIEPIDTAAHLKLVGDSLSIIGIRLQEHRTEISEETKQDGNF